MAATEILEVTVTVGAPYVLVGGGWTGMRPLGLRRDYSAEVFGRTVRNTSKSEIQSYIRQLAFRETGSNKIRFSFLEV